VLRRIAARATQIHRDGVSEVSFTEIGRDSSVGSERRIEVPASSRSAKRGRKRRGHQ